MRRGTKCPGYRPNQSFILHEFHPPVPLRFSEQSGQGFHARAWNYEALPRCQDETSSSGGSSDTGSLTPISNEGINPYGVFSIDPGPDTPPSLQSDDPPSWARRRFAIRLARRKAQLESTREAEEDPGDPSAPKKTQEPDDPSASRKTQEEERKGHQRFARMFEGIEDSSDDLSDNDSLHSIEGVGDDALDTFWDVDYKFHDSTIPLQAVDSENVEEAGDDDKSDDILAELWLYTPHYMSSETISLYNWREIQSKLPFAWQWDVEYHVTNAKRGGQHGSWTCTPLEPDTQNPYPLTIAGGPVVLPVEYRWPPESGITPPPDPRATTPIDCRATLPLELVKDLFLTFQDSIGFYVLINGLLQVIVPGDYDTSWASSHLPHRYGGLKVCYIEQDVEPTMLPSATDTSRATTSGSPVGSHDISGIFRPASLSTQSVTRYPSLKLNDFIEARPLSNHRRERFSGRVGLRVAQADLEPLVVMSTHVITEAILAKSHRDTIFSRGLDNRFKKLEDDWNEHVEIWAGDKKVSVWHISLITPRFTRFCSYQILLCLQTRQIGTIQKTFDREVKLYPVGFKHDITLIKPSSPTMVEDIASPVANLGWLHQKSWDSLRQQTSTVKILADTESTQSGKSIKCSRPSDVLVVGEGIFLNQKAAAGSSKSLKDHDASTWNDLVSRALLYRVYPDFDPPNGHSGTALYADGVREDGTEGPGIVGFQSFVQRCGKVQSFDMEGPALERRLQLGVVAFYGAFEVPSELKQYDIV